MFNNKINENKILHPKLLVMRDFLFYLFNTIEETYLGGDITSLEDREKHFTWCFDKSKEFLNSLGFKFHGYNYRTFYQFFINYFYLRENETDYDKKLKNKVFELTDFPDKENTHLENEIVDFYKEFEKNLL